MKVEGITSAITVISVFGFAIIILLSILFFVIPAGRFEDKVKAAEQRAIETVALVEKVESDLSKLRLDTTENNTICEIYCNRGCQYYPSSDPVCKLLYKIPATADCTAYCLL